jgi:ribonuclease Z
MSLTFDVLGGPEQDNAVLLRVDSGHSISRLLFDCGGDCLRGLPASEILGIDHVFFSHLHMDHVSGFDVLFRQLYQRDSKPNQIWGPPETSRILQHRFQGYLWNLHATMNAAWHITDIHSDRLVTTRYELFEAFAMAHPGPTVEYQKLILETATFTVEAITMDHLTPVIAYVVREKPRHNIDLGELATLGLTPGPWMQLLKSNPTGVEHVEINGQGYEIAKLRETLLVHTPGDSVAYVTDFLLDETAADRLAEVLHGCHTIICESQYRHADLPLAQRNYHMTTTLSAQLAKRVAAQRLVLIHLSSRYQTPEWREMLQEAQAIFPAAEFPSSWNLGVPTHSL